MDKVLVPVKLTDEMRERMAHIEDGPARSLDEVWAEMIDAAFALPLPSRDSIWADLRHERASKITAVVVHALDKILGENDPECRAHQRASEALYELFYKAGAEIVDDSLRFECGLPNRDLKGWTAHELSILEAKRIETLLGPVPPLVVRAPR